MQHLIYTLIPHLKAHVPISDIGAPTLWIRQIIKVLMLDISAFIYSASTDDFSVIRVVESFIVNYSLELVKFQTSNVLLRLSWYKDCLRRRRYKFWLPKQLSVKLKPSFSFIKIIFGTIMMFGVICGSHSKKCLYFDWFRVP